MPYGYRGLKIFTSLSLRFQDFQRLWRQAHAYFGTELNRFIKFAANNRAYMRLMDTDNPIIAAMTFSSIHFCLLAIDMLNHPILETSGWNINYEPEDIEFTNGTVTIKYSDTITVENTEVKMLKILSDFYMYKKLYEEHSIEEKFKNQNIYNG